MHIDDTGWLVSDAPNEVVVRAPSVRTQALAVPVPAGIVWHWTGGLCRGAHVGQILTDEIRTFDRAKDRAASWNALIDKFGAIYQAVPFGVGSWHVGRPGRIGAAPTPQADGSWNATAWAGGKLFANINAATLGIELANAGRLEKVGDKFYCSPWWLDGTTDQPNPALEIEPARAVAYAGKWFDTFPQVQVDAAQKLLAALVLKYKFTPDVSRYGHVMFDPGRKEDPGPMWLENLLPQIFKGVFGS